MNVTIHWQYRTQRGDTILLTSEEMDGKLALQFAADMEKTGRVKEIRFLDRYDSFWTMKELKKYFQKVETEPHAIRIYFDGGFQHDTQLAGIGVVIYYEQSGEKYRLRKNSAFEYLTSNNEAEYAALYEALFELELLGAQHVPIDIYSDSQVVIHELNGDWGITEGHFDRWAQKIEQIINRLGLQPTYHFIPRHENKEADQLATQALNGIDIYATFALKK